MAGAGRQDLHEHAPTRSQPLGWATRRIVARLQLTSLCRLQHALKHIRRRRRRRWWCWRCVPHPTSDLHMSSLALNPNHRAAPVPVYFSSTFLFYSSSCPPWYLPHWPLAYSESRTGKCWNLGTQSKISDIQIHHSGGAFGERAPTLRRGGGRTQKIKEQSITSDAMCPAISRGQTVENIQLFGTRPINRLCCNCAQYITLRVLLAVVGRRGFPLPPPHGPCHPCPCCQ